MPWCECLSLCYMLETTLYKTLHCQPFQPCIKFFVILGLSTQALKPDSLDPDPWSGLNVVSHELRIALLDWIISHPSSRSTVTQHSAQLRSDSRPCWGKVVLGFGCRIRIGSRSKVLCGEPHCNYNLLQDIVVQIPTEYIRWWCYALLRVPMLSFVSAFIQECDYMSCNINQLDFRSCTVKFLKSRHSQIITSSFCVSVWVCSLSLLNYVQITPRSKLPLLMDRMPTCTALQPPM